MAVVDVRVPRRVGPTAHRFPALGTTRRGVRGAATHPPASARPTLLCRWGDPCDGYFAAFTSIFFTLSILWQSGLGHSALATGIVLLPFAVSSIAGASISDSLAAKFGRPVLTIGLALVAAGITAIWIILLTVPTATLNGWQLAAPLLIAGFGSGLFIAPNVDFIVAGVDPAEAGTASGIIGTAQRIGSAIGIAVIATVLFGTLGFTNAPDAALIAFTRSATCAMGLSAAFALVAFALVFTLPRTAETWPHDQAGGERWLQAE